MRIENQDNRNPKLFNINSILAYGFSYQDTRKEGIPGHNILGKNILHNQYHPRKMNKHNFKN